MVAALKIRLKPVFGQPYHKNNSFSSFHRESRIYFIFQVKGWHLALKMPLQKALKAQTNAFIKLFCFSPSWFCLHVLWISIWGEGWCVSVTSLDETIKNLFNNKRRLATRETFLVAFLLFGLFPFFSSLKK